MNPASCFNMYLEMVLSPSFVEIVFISHPWLLCQIWDFLWVLSSNPLVRKSILIQYHAVLITVDLCYSFKLGNEITPNFLFLGIALSTHSVL